MSIYNTWQPFLIRKTAVGPNEEMVIYKPADYIFGYSFLNMGSVNLTADKTEIVFLSQCRNTNKVSFGSVLECFIVASPINTCFQFSTSIDTSRDAALITMWQSFYTRYMRRSRGWGCHGPVPQQTIWKRLKHIEFWWKYNNYQLELYLDRIYVVVKPGIKSYIGFTMLKEVDFMSKRLHTVLHLNERNVTRLTGIQWIFQQMNK